MNNFALPTEFKIATDHNQRLISKYKVDHFDLYADAVDTYEGCVYDDLCDYLADLIDYIQDRV
jgi:hypothetical protein